MRSPQCLVWLLVVVSLSQATLMANDAEKQPGVKVEFYWSETRFVPGLTGDNGFPFGEGGERVYPHVKPILTNEDVVSATVSKLEFPDSKQAPVQYSVSFTLTKEARKRLADTCDKRGDGLIAAFVDGEHRSTSYYLKQRDETQFSPRWGYTLSRAKIDQIVATFAKPRR